MSDDHVHAALRDHLLAHSVRRGDFTLKSGRKSTWFIDSKQTVCRPEAMVLVAEAVLSLAWRVPEEATAIGELTMGADPVAFVHGRGGGTQTGPPQGLQRLRKEEKGPRRRRAGSYAGALDQGDKVVVTEDTVARGTSLLEAALARYRRPERRWCCWWRWSTAGAPGRGPWQLAESRRADSAGPS